MDDCFHCHVHQAVLRFSERQFAELARKVVYRLRRFPATGVYEQDPPHRTLWDEYCHEVQFGSDPDIEWGWRGTLPPFYLDLLSALAADEARLLAIGAAYEVDFGETPNANTLGVCLEMALRHLASGRNMSRFQSE